MTVVAGQASAFLLTGLTLTLLLVQPLRSDQRSNSGVDQDGDRRRSDDQRLLRRCVGGFYRQNVTAGGSSTTASLCNLGNNAYAAYFRLGSPGYGVWLEVDTGSADTWTMGAECPSESCRLRPRFDPGRHSKTFRPALTSDLRPTRFRLTYGGGVTVEGSLAEDRLCWAENRCSDRLIGLVDNSSQTAMHSDGVIGLAFDQLSRFGAGSSFLTTLTAASSCVFAIRLPSDVLDRSNENEGQLTIGDRGSPPTTTTPVSLPISADNKGFWMIDLAQVQFSDSSDQTKSIDLLTDAKAVLDTGSTYILSPSPTLQRELQRWHRSGLIDRLNDHWLTDCHRLGQLPGLRFKFCSNNKQQNCTTVELSADQYSFRFDPRDECRRRLGLQFSADLPFTVLGSRFLVNFYSVFDCQQRRVHLYPDFQLADHQLSAADRPINADAFWRRFEINRSTILVTFCSVILLSSFRSWLWMRLQSFFIKTG